VLWAVALVGVASLTAAYFSGEAKNAASAPTAKIRVVSSTAQPSPAPKVEPLSAPPRPTVEPIPAGPHGASSDQVRTGTREQNNEAPARPHPPAMEQGSTDARRLTRAFGKQQSRIEACFAEHAQDPANLPPIQFDFTLDPDGKLGSAEVAPPAVASTPLGKCLKSVAGQTTFPAPGKPLTFSIPLLTQKRSTD
jgi:hypothetical protein